MPSPCYPPKLVSWVVYPGISHRSRNQHVCEVLHCRLDWFRPFWRDSPSFAEQGPGLTTWLEDNGLMTNNQRFAEVYPLPVVEDRNSNTEFLSRSPRSRGNCFHNNHSVFVPELICFINVEVSKANEGCGGVLRGVYTSITLKSFKDSIYWHGLKFRIPPTTSGKHIIHKSRGGVML